MYFSMDNFNIITLNHMKMKTAFVGPTRNFGNEIDLAGSEGLDDMKVVIIKPQKI